MAQPEAYGTPPALNQKSWDGKSLGPAGESFSAREVTDVFRTIAAHGGGAASFDLALDLVLNQVVEQARLATGATGAAIALARAGEIVCRATSGADAPELGVRLDLTSGLSGACLQTGTMQRCGDTETDPRVNAEDCRRLGLRSIVMLPLEGEKKERLGILQAFSSWPNAFSDRDVNTLQALARRVVENVAANAAGNALGNPLANPVGNNFGSNFGNIGGGEAVAAGVPSVDETADAPQDLRSSSDRDLRDQDLREEDLREEERLWPVDARNPGEEELSGAREVRRSVWTSVLGLLVIVLAVVLGMALGWRAGVGRQLRGAQTRIAATAGSTGATNPGSDSNGARETAARASAAGPASAGGLVSPSKPSGGGSTVEPLSGGLLVTENGRVIYRLPAAEKLSGDRTPATAKGSSTASVRVSATRLIHRVEPQYPAEASAKHMQGVVTLDVQIGTDGVVHNITVVEGDAALAEAAVQAVRQWRYQPSLVNGRAVEMETRVTIRFTLPQG
jgi:TonB family protein